MIATPTPPSEVAFLLNARLSGGRMCDLWGGFLLGSVMGKGVKGQLRYFCCFDGEGKRKRGAYLPPSRSLLFWASPPINNNLKEWGYVSIPTQPPQTHPLAFLVAPFWVSLCRKLSLLLPPARLLPFRATSPWFLLASRSIREHSISIAGVRVVPRPTSAELLSHLFRAYRERFI